MALHCLIAFFQQDGEPVEKVGFNDVVGIEHYHIVVLSGYFRYGILKSFCLGTLLENRAEECNGQI